jgi:competence protein ComEC
LVNDASLAVHATVSGVDVWFLGDLETGGQAALVQSVEAARAGETLGETAMTSAVVVAHHGSAKQDRDLARLLAPGAALFSAGADNDYGHPTDAALSLYEEVGAAIGRTDRDGHLVIGPDGSLVGSRTGTLLKRG